MNPEKLQAIADPNFTPETYVSDTFISLSYHIGTTSEVFEVVGHLLEIVTSLQITEDLSIENLSYLKLDFV